MQTSGAHVLPGRPVRDQPKISERGATWLFWGEFLLKSTFSVARYTKGPAHNPYKVLCTSRPKSITQFHKVRALWLWQDADAERDPEDIALVRLV